MQPEIEQKIIKIEKEKAVEKTEKRIHKHRMYYYGSMTVIGTALILILYVLFLLFWPFKTLEFNQPMLKVLNTDHVVKQGEDLKYEVDYCRFTTKQARIVRNLQDGILYILPTEYTQQPTGCQVVYLTIEIPKAVAPGKYTLHQSIEFELNPLRTDQKEINSEPFTVTK